MKPQRRMIANLSGFWRRCLAVAATVVGSVAVLWFIWSEGHVLLLLFAAFLVATVFDSLARLLSRLTGLSRYPSVIVVFLLIVSLAGTGITFASFNIAAKAPRVQAQIEQSINHLHTKLGHNQTIGSFFGQSQGSGSNQSFGQHVTSELSNVAPSTFSTLADLFVIFIVGIYLSLRPDLYYRGLLRLFPPARRDQVDLIAHEAANAVRRWLFGRAISMSLVAVGSIGGLWVIGLPFPFLLGILAGLLTFIPYLGTLIAIVPAILIASLHGIRPMLYVGILYLLLHLVEGYLLAPLVQRRAVSIAPAFLLAVQMLGGAIAGILGIALATPIALVIAVTIQLSYVQNVIGEEPHLPNHALRDD
jgi:predicted PurR-regulated permease PerM